MLAFAIFTTIQALVYLARRRFPHRASVRRVMRVFGTVGTLPLFVGAGGIMIPTVLIGGPVLAHPLWPRTPRIIAGVAAALPVLMVSWMIVRDFGLLSWHTPVGIVLLVAIYGIVVGLTLLMTVGISGDS